MADNNYISPVNNTYGRYFPVKNAANGSGSVGKDVDAVIGDFHR